jgi:hypothetical protein
MVASASVLRHLRLQLDQSNQALSKTSALYVVAEVCAVL